MKQNVFVFYVRPYSFEDEQTGQKREGVSVNYIVCDDPFKDSRNTDGSYGYAAAKDSLPPEKMSKIGKVPGMYEADFVMAPSRGATRLRLNDLTFKSV